MAVEEGTNGNGQTAGAGGTTGDGSTIPSTGTTSAGAGGTGAPDGTSTGSAGTGASPGAADDEGSDSGAGGGGAESGGGSGGAGSGGGFGGGGGGGGARAATSTGASPTLNQTTVGGNGGNGADADPAATNLAGGGGGGGGGYGVVFGGSGTLTVGADVTGGNGGNGGLRATNQGNAGSGGSGAAGLFVTSPGVAIRNNATITGGNGGTEQGFGGVAGAGGAGVSGSGLSITNSGTITGGEANAGNGAQADSIDFTGGNNNLDLSTGTLSGNIGVDGTGTTLDFVQIVAETLASAITGAGGIIDSGAGTLTLSAANTYSGATTISAGTLQLGAGGATGSIANTSGITDNAALVVDESGAVTLAAPITGSGTLAQTGTGTTTLSAANAYSGGTTIAGGTLDAAHNSGNNFNDSLGSGAVTLTGGGTLVNGAPTGTAAILNAIAVGGGGGTVDGESGFLDGAISGTGLLTLTGSGVLLGADNSGFSGTTTLADGVTVQAGATNAFSPNSAFRVGSGTTLDLDGRNQTIALLADGPGGGGTVKSSVRGATLTLGDNFNTSFSGTIQDGIGSLALTKIGTGSFTLTGADTYTGATTISQGTLQLGNGSTTGSIAAASAVADNAGASLAFDRSNTIVFDNTITGPGALDQIGGGTLDLTAANAGFSGAVGLDAGTLELGQQSSAGTDAITFGANAETLRLDSTGTLGASVASFAAGDDLDLAAVASTATASYANGVLTVSDGTNSDVVTINAAPPGKQYAISNDGNGHALVTLAAIPTPAITAPANGTDTDNRKPTISGTGENGDTVDLTITPANGGAATTGTATVTNGAWSFAPASPLADGSYSVSAVATSPSGTGTSATSNTESFTVDTTAPTVTSDTASPATGDLGAGKTITFTLATSEAVTVTAGPNGATPTLTLNDGGTATYTGPIGPATGQLTFSTTVAAGQNASVLAVQNVALNGSTIEDQAGNAAVLSGADKSFNGLQVDTTAPAAPPTPSDAAVKNGYVDAANDTASQAVTGTAEAGSTVTLSDNGNVVGTTTANASTGVWGVTVGTLPNGSTHSYTATATDAAGNVSPMSGALAFTVDTTASTVTAIADSGPGIDANGNGDLDAGKTVMVTVTTSKPVTVTPGANGATPTATLDDGGTATYSGGSGTNQITFTYTVAAGQNTAHLAVTSVNANGATVTDAAGNPINPSLANASVPSGTLIVDTTAPVVTADTASPTTGDFGAGNAVTFTLATSEPVAVTGTPTLTLNDGGMASYVSGSGSNGLVFSTTVAAGQNTANLAVTGSALPNGAAIQDAAGNNADLSGAAKAFTGLEVDTTAPAVSSPTDIVAQNSGPTPIGIAAPSDNLTPQGSLAMVAGSLPGDGTVTLADGTTPVTTGETLTATQLTGLEFTPTPGAFSQGSTFTYTVTDGAGNAATGAAALDIGGAGAPTITGTHASSTSAEGPVAPFAGVTLADPSQATETLTIAIENGAGTLAGAGLVQDADGSYTLAGSTAAVTQELDALGFTPSAPAPGTSATTTFVLSDASSAGTSVADAGTSVTDTAAAAPPPSPPPTPPRAPSAPDTVSIDPRPAFAGRGTFLLTGTASSPAGVKSVEVSAEVDGVETDLGAASVNADGTFTFADKVGPHTQGFITATETDGAGGTASGSPPLSLEAGLTRTSTVAREDHYTPDGSATTTSTLFRHDGSSTVEVRSPGQTVASNAFDVFDNHHRADTTFVFDPGFGVDVVGGFRAGGAGHDVLDLPSSDFKGLADVLRHTGDIGGSAFITDPVTGDAIRLAGVTAADLKGHSKDFAFHA